MSSLFVAEDDNISHQAGALIKSEEQFAVELSGEDEQSERPADSNLLSTHEHTKDDTSGSIPVEFQDPQATLTFPLRDAICNLPLKFQQLILEDMLARDALLVLGRGLGWEIIIANLLYILSSPVVTLGDNSKPRKSLSFLLNARDDEIWRIKEELDDLLWVDDNDVSEADLRFIVVTGDTHNTSSKRKNLYLKGGIIAISSRVLVVDLLSGILQPSEVTGLFVLHAERLKETSNEAFILGLYRDKNDWGFIKAISDEPELILGFSPLGDKLKILRLSQVLLWPRFHVEVISSLVLRPRLLMLGQQKAAIERRLNVTEINVQLSYKMTKIQLAILACIKACLQELKRHNPELAVEYWDMENAHDPNFVRRIRGSLDAQWHRLSYTTKQLAFDLGTLTDLLRSLVTLDAFSFYQTVQGIVDQNVRHVNNAGAQARMSPWLELTESVTIVTYAQERALGKIRVEKKVFDVEEQADEKAQESCTTTEQQEYVLEELPKWNQLGLLLDDILHEKSMANFKNDGPIMIMCSSRKVVDQLSQLLRKGKEQITPDGRRRFSYRDYMVQRLDQHLAWKEINLLAKQLNQEMSVSSDGAEENGAGEVLSTSKTFSRNNVPVSKRRRTRGASATARVSRIYASGAEPGNDAAHVDEDILQRLQDGVVRSSEDEEDEDDQGESTEPATVSLFMGIDDEAKFSHVDRGSQIIIQAYNENASDALLQEICPSFIIMYEPDLSFVRRVELFQAINHDNPAKTYFMYYGLSVEEEKHLLRIKKEKEAFTRLIREKASLGKHFEGQNDNTRFNAARKQVINTRIAGGSNFRTESDDLRVVVDLREFRSSLPNLLYRLGVKVVPCMITVGDYIVTPKICVERKLIPDLIGSFKSGRLFQQCEQMFRHYELPTLLIEFDEAKSFSLSPFLETRFERVNPNNPEVTNLMQQNIQSKIMLLLIAFPKLKIIWLSSPYESAQILTELKVNQPEPDVGEAIDKGVNQSLVTQDGGVPVFNDDPIDFIQNIPGINTMNYHLVIQKVRSIEALVQLSKKEFEGLLGQENGRRAFNFLNRAVR